MHDHVAFQIHRYKNGLRNKKYELHVYLIIQYIRKLGYDKPTLLEEYDTKLEEDFK